MALVAPWHVKKKIGEEGGGGGAEGDLENCAYLWKNPGYAPVTQLQNCRFHCWNSKIPELNNRTACLNSKIPELNINRTTCLNSKIP